MKMKLRISYIWTIFVLFIFIPLNGRAQYSLESIILDVGEEQTVYLPSSVTSKDYGPYWEWSDNSVYIELSNKTSTSVTIKALSYTSTTEQVYFDYYWGNSREHGNYTINVDIRKPNNPDSEQDSGGNTDGKIFTWYSSGRGLYYKVISESAKTCMVGTDSNVDDHNAVSGSLSGKITIPYTANNYKVTKIGCAAFNACKYIESFTLPESITTIDEAAFQECTAITSFTIPNSVVEIANGAVSCCDKLKELTIGSSVTKIGGAFWNNPALESITILAVEPPSIASWAFDNSNTNATLYVPKGSLDKYKNASVWKSFKTIKEIGGSDNIPVTNIILNSTSDTLSVGDTLQLIATIYPNNATDKSVTWSTNNKTVASVSTSGLVKANFTGSATITCKANDGSGITAQCNIKINQKVVYPLSISLARTSISMKSQDNYKLSWSYSYEEDRWGLNKKIAPEIKWYSDNQSVATVDSTGNIIAIKPGIALITIKSENNLIANCIVTVIENQILRGDIKSFSVGGAHSLILMKDSTLWRFGQRKNSKSDYNNSSPIPEKIMDDVVSYSKALYELDHGKDIKESCSFYIVKSDGSLWTYGNNKYGQLGDATTIDVETPKHVMNDVFNVTCNSQTLILKKDGTLWGCGSNEYGQLGNDSAEIITTPKLITTNVASMSAGNTHTLILKRDGTLWGCGSNNYGQLGAGAIDKITTPIPIMTNVTSITANSYINFTLFLKSDCSLWGCGRNYHGLLGTGTNEMVTTPVQIMPNVASVFVGEPAHSIMILKSDGTLWACGRNSYGQLGDGTTEDVYVPKQIMDNCTSASIGYLHSLLFKADGTLWACGRNDYGQLGDGTCVNRVSPVKIAERVGSYSVVNAVTIRKQDDILIYNLSGQKLAAPQKGVNIIGGKKVVIK